MSKYRELLLDYLWEKNKIVRAHTKLTLTSRADFDEAATWSEEQCKTALNYMTVHNSCPWCALFACSVCGYGLRNGYCEDKAGKFRRVLAMLDTYRYGGPFAMPGFVALVEKTKRKLSLIDGRSKTNE